MGGASGAVAEDGTAAQANPAGLQYVPGPEIFLEYRTIDQNTTIDQASLGSLVVDQGTGNRNLPFLGLTSVSNPDTRSDPSFISFVMPLGRAAATRPFHIAVSRQVVLSGDRTLSSGGVSTEARFAFPSFPNTVNGSTVEAYAVDTLVSGSSSAEIVYWNAGGSLELTRDFSAGLTLTYATLDMKSDSSTEVIDPLQLFLDPTHPRFPAQPTTDVYGTSATGKDSDVTFTFGLHLHPDSVFAGGVSPWRFGAVYHKGASFSVPETTFLNGAVNQTFDTTIVVPDRYSISASYRPSSRWLFSFEIERVEYSDLLQGFRSGVNYLTGGQVAGGAFGIDSSRRVEFAIKDGFVPRAGLEYLLYPGGRGRRRMSLWAGYYRTPDDRIHMSHFNSDDTSVNAAYLEAFRGGEPANHFTGGVGLDLGSSSFRLAGESSGEDRQFVGSYAYRFGTGR